MNHKIEYSSKKSDCFEAFHSAHSKSINLPGYSASMPYIDWARLAFNDFYSKRSQQDLENFQAALASYTLPIVQLYEASLLNPEKKKSFVEYLLNACAWADVEHIWHQGSKLRAYIDVSLQAKILKIFLEHLTDLAIWPESNRLGLASLVVENAPSSRPGLIALAELQLEEGQFDSAIASSKHALALNSSCPTAQQVLFRAYVAKIKLDGSAPDSEVAMYDLKDRFCARPFLVLVTSYKGESFPCDCPSWLPYSIGNVLTEESADSIWNSQAAAEIRRSILDGDFSYCSRTLCPYIIGDTLPKKSDITDQRLRSYIENHTTTFEEGPCSVQLSHDSTCNLACPSCRTEIIVAKAAEQDVYAIARDRLILPLLQRVDGWCMITTGGDPFASRHYRSILAVLNREQYPTLEVNLLTNGLLLTPQQWDELKGVKEMLGSLQVSIDAATAETYEKVRRFGRWSDLMPNLEFISGLRQAGLVKSFGINFVVQKANFREMKDFVKLGMRLGVDLVLFQRILNFGTFEQQTFLENDVAEPHHPLHDELLEILRDPLFNQEIVELFTLVPRDSKYPLSNFFDPTVKTETTQEGL